MSNKIELKPIYELLGMNFFIPSYQRGYRWNRQQVKDLLDDIQEFKDYKKEGFYCIQPLVVKRSIPTAKVKVFKTGLENIKIIDKKEKLVEETEKLIFEHTQWEVIDRQQRLTTIYILLKYLENIPYSIEYETRNDSKEFLSNIVENYSDKNIDYHHIVEAKKEIDTWFKSINEVSKKSFLDTLLKDVQFIWYESLEEDPIKVFTRLNVGKISLTNAELIKALFLNKSNFQGSNQRIRLQQKEIAIEWDQIEYTLQNDEFWLFLHEVGYDKPTRIDFIFDLVVEKNLLNLNKEQLKTIGNDEHRTFRYFYVWVNQNYNKPNISEGWCVVKTIFQTFQQWFNDLELYHYIGFLVEHQTKITTIHDEWIKPDRTKSQFIDEYIIPAIKEKIADCSNLAKQYELSGSPKTQCRPILLLHNIQTVITQNITLTANDKYKLPVFYKFPFHLFKKEKWDVEHIDSHTENPLENEKEQKEWLKASLIGIADMDLCKEIEVYLAEKGSENLKFEDLFKKIVFSPTGNKLIDNEKDMLWNFTLLDSSTNRSYGNAIFPAKRRVIIGKDQGKNYIINDDLIINENDGAIAFIPPCTKNVFLKYYCTATNNLREWNREDAEMYLHNIDSVLDKFLRRVEL